MSSKAKWNERYRAATGERQASRVLKENLHLLPDHGRALDLACGSGANAMLLAQQGLNVDAWDIADVAIATLQDAALKRRLSIQAEVRDVVVHPPEPKTFDVIVVSYFLDRNIIPALIHALKTGGLIYYQTFTRQRVSDRGPQRAEFRLADQELLHLFSGLQVIFYREEGCIGDVHKGLRDEAMFIGRKQALPLCHRLVCLNLDERHIRAIRQSAALSMPLGDERFKSHIENLLDHDSELTPLDMPPQGAHGAGAT